MNEDDVKRVVGKLEMERRERNSNIIQWIIGLVFVAAVIAVITGHNLLGQKQAADNSANCSNISGNVEC